MLYSKVRAVLVKELRDTLRDRRTVFATLVVPVVLYPLMFIVFGEAIQTFIRKTQTDTYRVAVQTEEARAFFTALAAEQFEASRRQGAENAALARPGPWEAEVPPDAPRLIFQVESDPEEAVKNGRVQTAILVPAGMAALKEAPGATNGRRTGAEVQVLFDQAEHRSLAALAQTNALLERYRSDALSRRVQSAGLGPSFLEPFRIASARNVAAPEKVGGSSPLGAMFPLLFIMTIVAGALNPAIDLTAGEKERSTLETLISAPVQPLEVITGKFLAVAALALLNALLNVASFGLSFSLLGLNEIQGFAMPWQALPLILLLLMPLTLLFSALLVAVASLAASVKEAQVYCLPLLMLPMVGLMGTVIPGLEPEGTLLVVPVLNTALVIKSLLLGRPGLAPAFIFVFLSTCLYAVAALALAVRLFAREEVLFGGPGALRLFLNRRTFRPQPRPGPAEALLVAALLFPIHFYFSAALVRLLPGGAAEPPLTALVLFLLLPLVVVFLALPLAVAWYLRLDLAQTFRWRAPSARALAAGALLGISSGLLALQVVAWQERVWAPPSAAFERLEGLLRALPPVWALLLVGLAPALCEEHFFRGFLLSGLGARRGKWPAILISGLLFGAFHYSLYKQPVTSLLGFALAYLVWESASLWPAVLFHLLHNGQQLFYDQIQRWGLPLFIEEGGQLVRPRAGFFVAALVLFATGLWLAKAERPRAE